MGDAGSMMENTTGMSILRSMNAKNLFGTTDISIEACASMRTFSTDMPEPAVSCVYRFTFPRAV